MNKRIDSDMISRKYLLDRVKFDGRVVFVSPNDVKEAPSAFENLEPCDWCEYLAADLVSGSGFYAEVDGGQLVVGNVAIEKEAKRKINFCPMCGRSLVEVN